MTSLETGPCSKFARQTLCFSHAGPWCRSCCVLLVLSGIPDMTSNLGFATKHECLLRYSVNVLNSSTVCQPLSLLPQRMTLLQSSAISGPSALQSQSQVSVRLEDVHLSVESRGFPTMVAVAFVECRKWNMVLNTHPCAILGRYQGSCIS